MCGVIGYKGKQQALPVMQKLMKHLDYRGYDSHGLCFVTNNNFEVHKALGSADTDFSQFITVDSHCAIGHVRWATNGEASLVNAHPHTAGNLALVHNGVVKNVDAIRLDYQFIGDTDSEVLAHWLARSSAYAESLSKIEGDYALLFVLKGSNKLFAACRGIPLYVARYEGDYYVASSMNVFQEEFGSYEYVVLENNFDEVGSHEYVWRKGNGCPKGSFSVGESYNGVITLSEIKDQWCYNSTDTLELDPKRKLIMFGCGSSYNAALISRYFFREAGFESEVFIPSELKNLSYFNAHYQNAQYLAISQSGETKDVLDMWPDLYVFDAIVNAEHSTLERIANRTLHLRCGVERGIAATKTFSATLWTLLFLAMPMRAIKVAGLLEEAYPIVFGPMYPSVPASMCGFDNVFIFGGGITHYVNLEGALKMKEMAAVHAEAIPAAEVKHGPIVLVNNKTLAIFVLVNDAFDERIADNIHQIKARGGNVLILTNNGREGIKMPDLGDYIANSFVASIYLQLIAWEFGSLRGANIDRPLNLAKCVTV